jgi:hypothetical protein
MAFQDCIDIIRKSAGDVELTDIQLEKVASDVQKIIDKHYAKGSDSLEADVTAEIREIGDELRIANIIKQRNALFNKKRTIEMVDYVMKVWEDAPEKGIEALLVGINNARQGSRYSVASNQLSKADAYIGGLYSELEQVGLFKTFKSGSLDKDIYVATHRIHEGVTDLSDIQPEAVTIAKILADHNEYMRLEANRVGAAIGSLPGYTTTRTHDQIKIKKDEAGWLSFMEENVDFEKTLSDVEPARRLKKLREMYIEFSTGVHIKLKNSAESGPETTKSGMGGFSNVAKGMSKERVLHFKTPEAEFEYSQKFGSGKLAQSTFFNTERMAADTVLMERMGPNAKSNLDEVFTALLKQAKKDENATKLSNLAAMQSKVDRSWWPHLSGRARAVATGSETVAKWDSITRSIQQMSSLGAAVLSMPSDLAFYASEMNYQGRGFLSGAGEAVGGLLQGRTDPEMRTVLRSAGVMADGLKGSVAMRFDANDPTPGKVAAMTQHFFKWTGIQWWPDRLRDSFVASMSNYLADLSTKSFANLPVDMKQVLNNFALGEAEWGVISKSLVEASDGKKFMVPEGMDTLEDSVFGDLLKSQGVKATPASIKSIRAELANKMQTMYQDRATFAVVEGDIKTRATLVGGDEQGTWSRVIRNQIALFKSFPLGVLAKPIARDLFGRSESADWKTAVKDGKGIPSLVATMTTATLLGYVSMSLKDLAKGKEPRDPLDGKTMMAAFVQGGGMGIYGDFLFGEVKNRFGGGFIDTLLGPTAGDINSFFDLYGRLRDGDPIAAKSFRFVLNNTPGSNIFYTRLALDYLVLYGIGEHLSPGYLRRMESRLKRENDQTMFYPPSQHANQF